MLGVTLGVTLGVALGVVITSAVPLAPLRGCVYCAILRAVAVSFAASATTLIEEVMTTEPAAMSRPTSDMETPSPAFAAITALIPCCTLPSNSETSPSAEKAETTSAHCGGGGEGGGVGGGEGEGLSIEMAAVMLV